MRIVLSFKKQTVVYFLNFLFHFLYDWNTEYTIGTKIFFIHLFCFFEKGKLRVTDGEVLFS